MAKQAIVIAGPTASGKSCLSKNIALQLNTAIINADSRQCFTELGVAVAKPSKSDMQEVPHFFVNKYSFLEHITADDFAQFTEKKIAQLFLHHDVVVVSGGTGLYLKAWMEGLSPLPKIAYETRQEVDQLFERKGLDELLRILTEKGDPYLQSGETQNPARIKRAMEVMLETGKSILTFQQKKSTPNRDYQIHSFALSPEREVLRDRISRRTEKMFAEGMSAECMKFYPYRHHKNLKTVGYTEIFEGYDQGWSEDHVMEQVIIHTRQYAKRQMTWYRNQGNFQLLDPANALENILETITLGQ